MAKAYVKVTRTTTRRRVGEGSGRKTGKSTTGQKRCPNCGNTDQTKMNVSRRTCGLNTNRSH